MTVRAAWEIGGIICGYLAMSIILGVAVKGLVQDWWEDHREDRRGGW